MIKRKRTLWYASLPMLWPLSAFAQPVPGIILSGQAVTGPDTREVHVKFRCFGKEPLPKRGLSVELEVPNAAKLSPLFDFDPFEGPDASAGPLTQLTAKAGNVTVRSTSYAAGYYAGTFPYAFNFEWSMDRRGNAVVFAAMGRVLRPLTTGPATLQWRQGNAKAGGAAIVATVEVSAAQSSQLKTLLAPCLAAAPK